MGEASDDGRFIDDPPLPELKPPPPELIAVRGAQVVRVHHTDHPNPKLRGFTEVVVLAWARIPDSEHWAGLCVWLAAVQAWRPPHRYLGGEHGWHGQGDPGQVSEAIARAAQTLPEHLRERVLIPLEPGR